MLICKKVTSDFVVAVSVDKVAERVDITVMQLLILLIIIKAALQMVNTITPKALLLLT